MHLTVCLMCHVIMIGDKATATKACKHVSISRSIAHAQSLCMIFAMLLHLTLLRMLLPGKAYRKQDKHGSYLLAECYLGLTHLSTINIAQSRRE